MPSWAGCKLEFARLHSSVGSSARQTPACTSSESWCFHSPNRRCGTPVTCRPDRWTNSPPTPSPLHHRHRPRHRPFFQPTPRAFHRTDGTSVLCGTSKLCHIIRDSLVSTSTRALRSALGRQREFFFNVISNLVATFRVARLTLQTPKLWFVGVATERDARHACLRFFSFHVFLFLLLAQKKSKKKKTIVQQLRPKMKKKTIKKKLIPGP